MTRYNVREAVLVVIILALAYAGAAQDNGTAATTAPRETRVADNTEPPSGPRDGIKVHGHWTIVVRNADGSVASRHEFENALTTGSAGSGNKALAQFLARQYAIGTWQISLGNSNSSQDPCRTANGTPVICFIVEPTSRYKDVFDFPNLSVQVPTSGTNAFSIVLSGTATAAAAGSISNVYTGLGACPSSVSPSACSGSAENSTPFGFTGQNLSTAISVQAGQSISVTVVLSFS